MSAYDDEPDLTAAYLVGRERGREKGFREGIEAARVAILKRIEVFKNAGGHLNDLEAAALHGALIDIHALSPAPQSRGDDDYRTFGPEGGQS